MLTVTNRDDSGPGSLRGCIAIAAPGEEIQFGVSGFISLTTGELLISQDLIITGPGPDMLVIDGGGLSRVFNTNTGVISISGLTVLNGQGSQGGGIHNEATLTLNNVEIASCTSTDEGGGIWNSGTINPTDVTVVGCVAAVGDGGGIHNTGTVTATDLNLDTCSCSANGGGFFSDGTYDQAGGEITQCTSVTGGGGVLNQGTATFTQVSIHGNSTGGNGDGLLNQLGTVNLVRCAVYNNGTNINIFSTGGTLTISNSTLSGGTTVLSAMILDSGAAANIANSTITQHGSGIHMTSGCFLTLYNTILSGNDENDFDGFTADVLSSGNNILGVDSNEPITDASGDQRVLLYADLIVGPMQDNGGATFTHALLVGSPALNAGNNIDAPATDQRGIGFSRIVGPTIDIGAFELQSSSEPPIEPPVEPPVEPPEPEPTPSTPQAVAIGDCRRVSCCSATGVQFSDFTYSLVSGQTYTNSEFTLTVPCPVGYDCTADSVIITLPPGTVKFTPTTVGPNPPPSGSGDPWNPEPGKYEFTCGTQTLTITALGPFTQAQLDAIINFLSNCQAVKDGNAILQPTPVTTPSGQPGIRLWNTEQTYTAECPEGETGDPVTVTIPAKTHSNVILASSTPLQKYLAQQALNQFTLDEAAAQAEGELECIPTPVCPELKSTFLFTVPSRTWGAAYGLTNNLTYFSADTVGGLNVFGVDDDDLVSLTVTDAGATTGQGTMVYSELHNALYVGCLIGGLPAVRVLAAADLSTVTSIDISGLGSAPGRLSYFESVDLVAASFDNEFILLIDGTTNTVIASANDSNPQQVEVAYVPSSGRVYCPTGLIATAEITIRNISLTVTGSIVLGPGLVVSGIVRVPTDGQVTEKLVMAVYDTAWSILVVDPATDTVTNSVATGVTAAGGGHPNDFGIVYDPTMHLVYFNASPNLMVFNVIDETMMCVIGTGASFDSKQIGVNTTLDRFYLAISNLNTNIRKYGQPDPP